MSDKIKITILEDGTIKLDTDQISGPQHMNAEAFLREITRLAGGKATRTLKAGAHAHTHSHHGVTHSH